MKSRHHDVSKFTLIKLLLFVSTLILFCTTAGPATAQSETARVVFQILLQDLSAWKDDGQSTTISIQLVDINRPNKTPERVVLTIDNRPDERSSATEKTFEVSHPLAEGRNQWLVFRNTEASFYVYVKDLEWSNDTGTILFSERWGIDPSAMLFVEVEPGRYLVSATVTNSDGTLALIDKVEKDFAMARSTDVPLRQPTHLGYLWELVSTREGILGTIILTLVAILLGVLKDNITSAFGKLLDLSGKYFGGRLRERRFLKKYLDQLIFNHKYLKLIGFNTTWISRPLLEEVFVSLRIATNVAESGNGDGNQQRPTISFNAAFKQYRSMVILGGPGAGKTTTLSYALLVYAKNQANQQLAVNERLLPIYVPLRRLSNTNRSIVDDVTDKETQILSAEILKEYPTGYFERKLKKGECLILLDGLDEVLDQKTHRQIAERIDSLVAAYPGNRFVVTCRTAGWQDLLSGEFAVLAAQDFDREEIQRFVLGWHRAVITQLERSRLQSDVPDKKRFEKTWKVRKEEYVRPAIDIQSRNLVHAIDSNNRLLAIAVNPMLLSLISLVHLNQKILPRGRTVLYGQCLDLLIDSWERTKDFLSPGIGVTATQKEAVLREIAFDFQSRGRGEDSRANLEQLIARIAAKLGISTTPKNLLEDIETRSGLLTERSIDVFGFTHLTLQEYLVARHIQLNQVHTELLVSNFDNQAWREVILLYTGLVDDATELIAGVASADSLERQILAGYCVGDAQHCNSELAQTIIDRILSELTRRKDHEDELVSVIASIARDYQTTSMSVEENLSKDFILRIYDSTTLTTDRLHSIAAMGRARVTQALPGLVCMLEHDDERIKTEARAAVIQFGDLALPTIESFLKADFASSCLLRELVPVLAGINTGSSAMALLRLYRLQNPDLDVQISLALASMMTNPLVEAELLALEVHQLPASLAISPIDRNGWSYKSAKSGLWFVDTKIRRDVGPYIAASHVDETVDRGILNVISFKILFPALLTYVKSWPKRPIKHEPEDLANTIQLLLDLGFDRKLGTLLILLDQVKAQPEMPLDLALQRIEGANKGDYSSYRPPGDRLWNLLANGYFIAFWWAQFYFWYNSFRGWSHYDFAHRTMNIRQILSLSSDVIQVAFFVVAIALTIWKLRIRIPSVQLASIILNPIPSLLKVLPYITKLSSAMKLFIFLVLLIGLSPFPFLLPYLAPIFFFADPIPIFVLTSPLFLTIAILYYWKYRVLAQNPIYELITLHPRGRELIGAANESSG